MPANSEPLRFVVLLHDQIPQPHYDLLVQTSPDALLATWRCPHWPLTGATDLQRQPDHRRIYLDYQGTISGGRGRVTQIDAGRCKPIRTTPDLVVIDFFSPKDSYRIVLARKADDTWTATRTASLA